VLVKASAGPPPKQQAKQLSEAELEVRAKDRQYQADLNRAASFTGGSILLLHRRNENVSSEELGKRINREIERLEAGQEQKIELPPFLDGSSVLDAPDEPEPAQLIEGILHQGLKAELAGASKSMKSWLALSIAVCIATATPWLGPFKTTQARVLYLNLEVPRWHFHKRLRQITEALGVKLDPEMFMFWNLRGHDLSRDNIWNAATQRIMAAGSIGLILADPLYKLFNELRAENETTGTTAIMRRFDLLAEQTGASPLFTHHFTKGSPATKEAMDRFAGSSVLIRDPDVYLCMTRHEQEDAFTMEFTLRCLPPIKPFVVRWQCPLFELDSELDPELLRQAPGKAGRKPTYSVDQLVACLSDSDELPEPEFEKRVRGATKMAHSTFLEYRDRAEAQKLIFQSKLSGSWQRYPNDNK
jgi:RecA-family ATPase